jgi:hypothetical protein
MKLVGQFILRQFTPQKRKHRLGKQLELFRQPRCRISSLNTYKENSMAAKKKSTGKKSGGRKYGEAAGKSVESAMRRKNRGTLKSGPGGKGGTVKSRKQAIAIGLSEAREKGAKVPRKRSAA